MRVVHVTHPKGRPTVRVVEIPDDEGEERLRACQKLVGGLIDCINLSRILDLWINDEGLLLELPVHETPFANPRPFLSYGAEPFLSVAGDYYMAGLDPEEGEGRDLSDGEINAILKLYRMFDADVQANVGEVSEGA